jgi:integrase
VYPFRDLDFFAGVPPTEVRALLSAARGDRLEALYVVAIHTGLRRSEILGLKWTDVVLDGGILSVQRSLDTDGTFNPPKRKKSRRTVKLTAQAVEALKSHRARQNEERFDWAPSGMTMALCSLTSSAGR